MPITPLHFSIGYLSYLLSGKKLNLPALVISSMLPDLEVPVVCFLTGGAIDRLVLHSIPGSIVIGIPLTIFVILPLYKKFFTKYFGVKKSLFEMNNTPKNLILSSLVGVLSHVLIDATQHPFNPVLWPIVPSSFDYFILFNNLVLASNFVYMLFMGVTVVIIVNVVLNKKNFVIQLFVV